MAMCDRNLLLLCVVLVRRYVGCILGDAENINKCSMSFGVGVYHHNFTLKFYLRCVYMVKPQLRGAHGALLATAIGSHGG